MLDHHPAFKPVHQAGGTSPAPVVAYRPATGGGFLDTVKTIGSNFVKSGVLSKIPYVGSVLQGLAGGLMKIFGK